MVVYLNGPTPQWIGIVSGCNWIFLNHSASLNQLKHHMGYHIDINFRFTHLKKVVICVLKDIHPKKTKPFPCFVNDGFFRRKVKKIPVLLLVLQKLQSSHGPRRSSLEASPYSNPLTVSRPLQTSVASKVTESSKKILQSYRLWGSVWKEPLLWPSRRRCLGIQTPILTRYFGRLGKQQENNPKKRRRRGVQAWLRMEKR